MQNEHGKWCKGKDIVYIDGVSGEEYCVYHAPQEHKNVSVDEFRDIFWDDLSRRKMCNFKGSIFVGDIELPPVNCTDRVLNFSNCIFQGDFFVKIRKAINVDFSDATFCKNMSIAESFFEKECRFRDTKFYYKSDFNNVNFKEGANFRATVFEDKANFYQVYAPDKSILFQRVNLDHLSLPAREVPFCLFRTCTWPQKLYPETINPGIFFEWKALRDLYRAFKQRAFEERDMPMMSRWHRREKEMEYKEIVNNKKIWNIYFWGLLIYRYSSGFGESPRQALRIFLTLILIIFIISFIMHEWVLPSGGSIMDCALSIWNTSGDAVKSALYYLPFTKVPRLSNVSGWECFLMSFSQLVISIQAALLGFAVRNTFRR